MKTFKQFLLETVKIGTSWDSLDGKRTIVGTSPGRDGTLKYNVKTDNSPFGALIAFDEIEREMKLDADKLKSRQEMEKRKAEQDRKEKEEISLDGFEDTLTPAKRGVAVKALTTKGITSGGVFFKNIRDLIRFKVKSGARVNQKRRLENPDGSFSDEKQLTKIGIDYAEWLSKNLTKLAKL